MVVTIDIHCDFEGLEPELVERHKGHILALKQHPLRLTRQKDIDEALTLIFAWECLRRRVAEHAAAASPRKHRVRAMEEGAFDE